MTTLYKNTRTGDVVDVDELEPAGREHVLDNVAEGIWVSISSVDDEVDSTEKQGILSQPEQAVSTPFEATVEKTSRRRQGIAKALAASEVTEVTPPIADDPDAKLEAAKGQPDVAAASVAPDVHAQGQTDVTAGSAASPDQPAQ